MKVVLFYSASIRSTDETLGCENYVWVILVDIATFNARE